MGETRYNRWGGIREEPGEVPRFIHKVDQFYWYRDIKSRNLGEDSDIESLLNAVRFNLPYRPGRDSPPYLMVVGDGLSICNVYLIRTREIDILTGRIPTQESECIELFSYSEAKNRSCLLSHEIDAREIENSLPMIFHKIFTTDIMPFLKGGDYPIECDRIYEISPSYNLDRIKITAENRKDREKQKLRIIWTPDKRDGKEREIIQMQNLEWCIKEFRSDFKTSKFTFTSSINAINF